MTNRPRSIVGDMVLVVFLLAAGVAIIVTRWNKKETPIKSGACLYLTDSRLYGEVVGSGLDETGARIYNIDTSSLYRQYSQYSEQALKEQARGVACDDAYVHMALQDKDMEINKLQLQIDMLQLAVDNLVSGRY